MNTKMRAVIDITIILIARLAAEYLSCRRYAGKTLSFEKGMIGLNFFLQQYIFN